MKNTLVNRIITLVFIILICVSCFTPLNLFVYSALFVLFLIFYIGTKQWFCVSMSLCFFMLKIIPIYGIFFVIFITFALLFPKLRETLTWIKKGRIDKTSGLLIAITCVISIISLLIWAHKSNFLGVGAELFSNLLKYYHVTILCAIIPILAVINAFIEESVFRGVLQESLLNIFKSKCTSVVLQAIPFASLHYSIGFPNGIVGFMMVFVWGSVLGWLRERTDGLLAPIICHIAADTTIFYYLLLYVAC